MSIINSNFLLKCDIEPTFKSDDVTEEVYISLGERA